MTTDPGLLSQLARARLLAAVAGLVCGLVVVHLVVVTHLGTGFHLAPVVACAVVWAVVATWALARRGRASTAELTTGWALGGLALAADGALSSSPHHDLLAAVGLTGVAVGAGLGARARDAVPAQALVIASQVGLVLVTEGTGALGVYVAASAAATTAGICAAVAWVDGLRRTATAALAAAAVTDPLTGLANRRGLAEQFPAVRARAVGGASTALLAFDVDHFKAVNDTFGHDQGDRVLAAVAAVLSSCVRSGDLVVRLGGEELAVVGTWPSPAEAVATAERVRCTVAAAAFPHGSGVTLSAGVALWGAGGEEVPDPEVLSELMVRADRALYRAKARGRDSVVLATDAPRGGAVPAATVDGPR